MTSLLATLAAILPGWIVAIILSRALLRERAEVRRLKAELRERGPATKLSRGVVVMRARGAVRVGSCVAVNEDGTVSVSIGDDAPVATEWPLAEDEVTG